MTIIDFYKLYLEQRYTIYFDVINGFEYINTLTNRKNLYIKSYKKQKNKKYYTKCTIGNFIINLLNKSNSIISQLENYKNKLYSINNEMNVKKSDFNYSYNTFIIHKVEEAINQINFSRNNIERIFQKTSKKSGYVTYNNIVVSIPNATILHKKTKTSLNPYIYKYEISNLAELFNVSIHSIYLSKHRICKCTVCNKYFLGTKLEKTCSNDCKDLVQKLTSEKNRFRNRERNSEPVIRRLGNIRSILNKRSHNKKKTLEHEKAEKLKCDFEKGYKEKIALLKTRYKFSSDKGYQKELLEWLNNWHNKIREEWPSKKYGNINAKKW